MRIIAGSARGRLIQAPKGDRTRPTADRVRESIFDVLAPRLPSARVLDLFAGSGALGLEALSRGAELAVFVESARPAFTTLRSNIETMGFSSISRLYNTHFVVALRQLLRGGESFDIILVDPPYHEGYYTDVLKDLHKFLAPDGIAVIECDRYAKPETPKTLVVTDERRYGNVGVLYMTAKE